MSTNRAVDKIPEMANQDGIKIIILSCSRTGTLGLTRAFKILGYRPYHFGEVVVQNHMEIFEQGLIAEHNRLAKIKRYNRQDFDKWFAGYDVLVGVACYMPSQTLSAYLADPNVRFLLTEREPSRWVKSFNSFIGAIVTECHTLPLSLFKHFNYDLWHFDYLNKLAYWVFSNNMMPGEQGCDEALESNYIKYIQNIKATVPNSRLTVIKLEEGLGWEELCGFTGDKIPQEDWPISTDHMKGKNAFVRETVSKTIKRGGFVALVVVVTIATLLG